MEKSKKIKIFFGINSFDKFKDLNEIFKEKERSERENNLKISRNIDEQLNSMENRIQIRSKLNFYLFLFKLYSRK